MRMGGATERCRAAERAAAATTAPTGAKCRIYLSLIILPV